MDSKICRVIVEYEYSTRAWYGTFNKQKTYGLSRLLLFGYEVIDQQSYLNSLLWEADVGTCTIPLWYQ